MILRLPDLDRRVPELAEALDRQGFVCLDNAVPEEWLDRAQAEVRGNLDRYGERFFSLIRPADAAESAFHALVGDPQVVDLLRGLTLARCPQGALDDEAVYNVLRVIAGPDGADGANQFHYDASVVTMLVPLFMPEQGRGTGGELLTEANRRPYRRSTLGNLAEKALVQNRFAWRRAARRLTAEPGHMQLLRPGNAYLFWGYRTYHGNLPCAPGSLRATLLLHYGNPHGNGPAMRAVRSLRRVVEARRRGRA